MGLKQKLVIGPVITVTVLAIFVAIAKEASNTPKQVQARENAMIPRGNLAQNISSKFSERSNRQYVILDRVAERLAPNASGLITNHIYRDPVVEVFEIQGDWARISKYYDGLPEGINGQVARWVSQNSLSPNKPSDPSELRIIKDRRVSLTRKAGYGLDENDVMILHAAAHYFLETGVAKLVVDGDKSVNQDGYYYLNFDKPQNRFFQPKDIPNLDQRVAELQE